MRSIHKQPQELERVRAPGAFIASAGADVIKESPHELHPSIIHPQKGNGVTGALKTPGVPSSTTRNNVSTYKMAPLPLPDRATPELGKTHVTMNELAQAFFHAYRQRRANGLPQQTNSARKTVLERVVEAYHRGVLTETAAIERVERQGFSDVVPRFHTVNGDPIPRRFYEAISSGLVLTDALLATFQGNQKEELRAEVASRWDLLEAAFAMHLPVEVLGTDEHMRLTDDRLRTDRHHRHSSGAEWLSEQPLLLLQRAPR